MACARLGFCLETSVGKVLDSFTCPLFAPVMEPIYLARVKMMQTYGDGPAVEAMMDRPEALKEPKEIP